MPAAATDPSAAVAKRSALDLRSVRVAIALPVLGRGVPVGATCGGAGRSQPITLHECRHTFASLLIDAGANPKAIQTFLGHSKIQTTFDVYGHLMPGSIDEVRSRMDAYIARAPNARQTTPLPSGS